MNRSGWLTFSAVVLIIAGIMRVIDAIWASSYHGALPDGLQGGGLRAIGSLRPEDGVTRSPWTLQARGAAVGGPTPAVRSRGWPTLGAGRARRSRMAGLP